MARRGYSRDSRPDCVQVCIGLVVTAEGIPLGYEVFSGNTHDSKTGETIVTAMESKYGRARRIWVMDRGMVSEKNLQYLRDRNGWYIVGTPKAMLKQFEAHLASSDWQEVQAGVEVKLVPGPDGRETFILARSPDRRKKEQAMHARFIERMEKALEKMQTAARSGRIKTVVQAHERLGRLRQQNWRSSGAFEVTITPYKTPRGQDRVTLSWKRNDRWREWSALSEGCYLLRTNLQETDPAVLWKRYIQLTEAEWAFRITKDELGIRPIWHHKTDRVQAHILVCFLAYVLWKTLSQWMKRSGLGDAPRPLVEELAKIKSGDVVLPARSPEGRVEREIRLRCVTRPDPAQKVLLHRLGLRLPERLGRFEKTVKCSEDF
jgi:transposase